MSGTTLQEALPLRIIATGTFTTSSATVPADAARGEATNHFDGCILLPIAGVVAFQPRIITTFTTGTGVFTLETAFTSAPGTVAYVILPAQAASIAAIAAIKTQIDKLAGVAPLVGSTTANWNTATGTSGESGEDLITIGANNTNYKIHGLWLNISALTVGAAVTIKMFMQINGTERKLEPDHLAIVGTTNPGIWLITGTTGIHEVLRVEVYSDTNESVAIDYDCMYEAM